MDILRMMLSFLRAFFVSRAALAPLTAGSIVGFDLCSALQRPLIFLYEGRTEVGRPAHPPGSSILPKIEATSVDSILALPGTSRAR